MKRLLILPAVAVVCCAEIVRRGFGGPLLYGARCWWAAVHREPCDHGELDYLA